MLIMAVLIPMVSQENVVFEMVSLYYIFLIRLQMRPIFLLQYPYKMINLLSPSIINRWFALVPKLISKRS